MASLSVYRGIFEKDGAEGVVPPAVGRGRKGIFTGLGLLLAVLCERGFSENLMECISQTALFDENAFSLAAAAGKTDFPPSLMAAVEHDLKGHSEYFRPDAGGFAARLPFLRRCAEWRCRAGRRRADGGAAGPIGDCIPRMAAYYRANGCGMYAATARLSGGTARDSAGRLPG